MFPETALPIQVDFQIDGAWEDHTDAVYSRGDIVITRGRSDEAQSVSPGRCAFQLNNRDGKYSPRNPLSPLYGKIGPGTPMRVSVRAGTPTWRSPAASTTARPPPTRQPWTSPAIWTCASRRGFWTGKAPSTPKN